MHCYFYDSETFIYQYLPLKHSVNMGYYTHFLINKLTKLSVFFIFFE
ncbi:hypothetical protein M917_1074 [Psychrobacter aquaticus CMS 56]|uniref:Uncharacterized protein n=1 Tax=Psychrobacter aquaticus CMS 56 TaxID=1354303 RepID=U4TBA9_9GAMM|nr:hypothetical protein M917_1074 [Psychrobacter aquaticus CMS 56]